MNYKRCILIFCLTPLINIYSQDNIIVGKYEGKIFSIVDSIGDFYIYKKKSSLSRQDEQEFKSKSFTIEILKTFKFSRSILNVPQAKYIFSNDDNETLVIQEFMDETRGKTTTIEVMPPCLEPSEIKGKRYARFCVKDRYLVYCYNIKSENSDAMFNAIQSIKSEE